MLSKWQTLLLPTFKWSELVTDPNYKQRRLRNVVPSWEVFLGDRSLWWGRGAECLWMRSALCHPAIQCWGWPPKATLSVAYLTMPSVNVFGALPGTKCTLLRKEIYPSSYTELFHHAASICWSYFSLSRIIQNKSTSSSPWQTIKNGDLSTRVSLKWLIF